MNLTKAVITAAGRTQRGLPLQSLVDRDGVEKKALEIILEEAVGAGLTKAGHTPKRISTTAKVNLEMAGGGPKITSIELDTEGEVPGIDEAKFKEIAEQTKKACPVSVALSGTEIKLNARLKN